MANWDEVYDDAKDVHVRNTYIYVKDNDGYAYADLTDTVPIKSDDLKDKFLKGLIVSDNKVLCRPMRLSAGEGTNVVVTYVKSVTETGPVLATISSGDPIEESPDPVVLSVSAEEDATTVLGKLVSDLQSDIVIGETAITGTLKYVTGYTEFSGDVLEQSGNYLALKISTVPNDTTTTVEVVGGTSGPATFDADMNCVVKIDNKDTETIRFVSSKTGYATTTKVYGLTGLTCEAEGAG